MKRKLCVKMSKMVFLLKIFVLKCYCFDVYLHPEKIILLMNSKTARNISVIYYTIATVISDDPVQQYLHVCVCVFYKDTFF